MMRVISVSIRFALLMILFAGQVSSGQTAPSGTIKGAMWIGERAVVLTHVYVMEPFVLPDTQFNPEVARRLMVVVSDRPYPADLPPIELPLSPFVDDSPFNGMLLEIDRTTGSVLHARPWLESTDAPTIFARDRNAISVKGFKITGTLASAQVGTPQQPAQPTTPINASVTVMRGTGYTHYGRSEPIQVVSRGTDGFNFSFTAPILPAPRILRVLIGHMARSSDIATAYVAIQASSRQTLLSANERMLSDLDPGVRLLQRKFFVEHGINPDMPSVELPRLERLEKIFVYQDRAILRFRAEGFQQDQIVARRIAAPAIDTSTIGLRRPDVTGHTDIEDPFANITVVRPRVPEQAIKP